MMTTRTVWRMAIFGALLYQCLLPSSCFSQDNELKTPTPEQFHLIVKQGMKDLSAVKVTWSMDGHYAALSPEGIGKGPWEIVVYDTRYQAEIRRVIASGYFNLGFARNSAQLFVSDTNGLRACSLETADDPCKTLHSERGFGLTITEDDQVVTLSLYEQHARLLLMNPARPDGVRTYRMPLPIDVKDVGGLVSIASYSTGGRTLKIAISIESNYDNGASKSTKPDVTYLSIVNLIECDGKPENHCSTEFQYSDIPLQYATVGFDLGGHAFLCGPRSTTTNGSTQAEQQNDSLYDPAIKRFVPLRSIEGPAPKEFDSCTGKVGENMALLGLLPRGRPIRWNSPQHDVVLYTQRNSTGTLELFEQRQVKSGPKPASTLLGGTNSAIDTIKIDAARGFIITQGLTALIWNTIDGSITEFPHTPGFNLGGDAAYFLTDPNTGKNVLWNALHNAPPRASPLNIGFMPSWVGVSADGATVAYRSNRHASSKLYVYVGDKLSPMQCGDMIDTTNDFVGSPNRVQGYRRKLTAFSPIANKLFSFCDNLEENGEDSTYLTEWDLPSLDKGFQVPAGDYREWLVLSRDGKTAILGGFGGIRVVDMVTKTYQDIDVGVRPSKRIASGEMIVAGELQQDDHTLVLAISSPRGSSIKLFNLQSKTSTQFQVSTGGIKSVSTNGNSIISVLGEDQIVSVYTSAGKRLVRLVSIGDADWLVFSDSGFFDGSSAALKFAAYQMAPGHPAVSIDQLFNDLYVPGLLAYALRGYDLSLPPGISLQTYSHSAKPARSTA